MQDVFALEWHQDTIDNYLGTGESYDFSFIKGDGVKDITLKTANGEASTLECKIGSTGEAFTSDACKFFTIENVGGSNNNYKITANPSAGELKVNKNISALFLAKSTVDSDVTVAVLSVKLEDLVLYEDDMTSGNATPKSNDTIYEILNLVTSKQDIEFFVQGPKGETAISYSCDICGSKEYLHQDGSTLTIKGSQDAKLDTVETVKLSAVYAINSDIKMDRYVHFKFVKKKSTPSLPKTSTTTPKEDLPPAFVPSKPDGYDGPLPDCAFDGTCRNVNDLLTLIVNWGQRIFGLIGSFALVMFIYGGFTMILSAGNSEKVKKGRDILVAAVIGLTIAFSAYLLVDFILDALKVSDEFRGIKQ